MKKVYSKNKKENKAIKNPVEYVSQKLRQRIKYLTFLLQGIEIFGLKKFNFELTEIGILRNANGDSVLDKDDYSFFSESDEKMINKILALVIEYNITIKKSDLFGKTIRHDVTQARIMAAILIERYTSLSDTEIGEYFNKTRQLMRVYRNYFVKIIKHKNKNARFLSVYNKIDGILKSKRK